MADTSELDILVQLGFSADEAALANTKNSLNAQNTLVTELTNRVKVLNEQLTSGAQRSVVEEAKLIQQFDKAKASLDKITTSYTNQKKVHETFNANLAKTTQETGRADQALVNFGRIVQDAPYGFIGISNNLNPMLESFQRLQQETGSVGGALKQMASGLTGAGGLGIAVSIATSLLVVFGDKLFASDKQVNESAKGLETLKDGFKSLLDGVKDFDEVYKNSALFAKRDYSATTDDLKRQVQLLEAVGAERGKTGEQEKELLLAKQKLRVSELKDIEDEYKAIQGIGQILPELSKRARAGAGGGLPKDSDVLSLYDRLVQVQRLQGGTPFISDKFRDDFRKQLTESLKSGVNFYDAMDQLQNEYNAKQGKATQAFLNKQTEISAATIAYQTDRQRKQYELGKSLDDDLFDLDKQLLDKQIENQTAAGNLSLSRQKELEEAKVLITQASALRAIAIERKKAEDEKVLNDELAGKLSEKEKRVNEIAKQELLKINNEYRKKEIEEINKFYADVIAAEIGQNNRRLQLFSKQDTDTLGTRLQQAQDEAIALKIEADKKYSDLLKSAHKYGLDVEKVERDYFLEIELIDGEARQKQLDALESYYNERITLINTKNTQEKDRIKFYSRNTPGIGIENAQADVTSAKDKLTEASAEFSRVYNLAITSQGDYSKALAKAQDDLYRAMTGVNETEEALYKARVARVTSEIIQYNNLVQSVGKAANAVLDIEIERTNALIIEQQRRVDAITKIASEGNANLLKAEQDRLDKLTQAQKKYQQEKRAIDAALVISQNLVNIATAVGAVLEAANKGSKQGGVVGLIVATVAAAAAVAAGIASSVAAVKSVSDTGYYKGGFTGEGHDHEEAGKVHKNEYVMDAKTTRKVGKKNLDRFRKGELQLAEVDYRGMYADANYIRKSSMERQYDFSRQEKRLDAIAEEIRNKEVSSLTADVKGFTVYTQRRMAYNEKMSKLQ